MSEPAPAQKLHQPPRRERDSGSSGKASDSDVELGEPVTEADIQDNDGAIKRNGEGVEQINEELQQACLLLFTNWLTERKVAEARRLAILKEKEADEVCLQHLLCL